MIQSVEIRLFRGIRSADLDGFAPLTILVGPNGSGKSAILEAILIAANPAPASGVVFAVTRHHEDVGSARWLFWKRGTEGGATIRVTARAKKPEQRLEARFLALSFKNGPDRSIVQVSLHATDQQLEDGKVVGKTTVTVPSPIVFSQREGPESPGSSHPFTGVSGVHFISSVLAGPKPKLHELYSQQVLFGMRASVNSLIKECIPDLVGLEILTEDDRPILHIVYNDRAVPVSFGGDGIALLVRYLCELAAWQKGIVLMEEPEAHLHPGAMRQCAKAVVAAVRRNTQIFIATHSLELIDAILSQCTPADSELLSLFRLKLQEGNLKHTRLSLADVALSRGAIEEDLR